MKYLINGTRNTLIALTVILAVFSISSATPTPSLVNVNRAAITVVAQDYSFKVHNNTHETITKILVSEDGKNYGYFDIGNGIAPGETAELVWDKSTNGESCHQYFKAMFSDGSESQPVKFDFCESGLVLEFS